MESEYSPRTEISQATQAQQMAAAFENEKEKDKVPNKKNSKKGKKDNTSPEPVVSTKLSRRKIFLLSFDKSKHTVAT